MSFKHVCFVIMVLLIAASIGSASAAVTGTSKITSKFPRISAFLENFEEPIEVVCNVIIVSFSLNRNYSPITFNFNFVR
jgi:hypothetical protein